MNILIYLIVAAVIGWVATEIMRDRSNLLINIVVAVLGAFLAGYFLSPIFGVGTINDAITLPTMLVTLLGSHYPAGNRQADPPQAITQPFSFRHDPTSRGVSQHPCWYINPIRNCSGRREKNFNFRCMWVRPHIHLKFSGFPSWLISYQNSFKTEGADRPTRSPSSARKVLRHPKKG